MASPSWLVSPPPPWQCLLVAAKKNNSELESLVALNTRLVAMVSNHDSIEADQDKLAAAAEVYRDLLSSVSFGTRVGEVWQ